MQFTSKRKTSYRISIRVMGILFVVGALAYLLHVFQTPWAGYRIVTVAVAVVFCWVGCSYIRQSLGITAYDVTYHILPDQLLVESTKKKLSFAYSDIKDVSLSKMSANMDYYLLHIIVSKYHFILHIENQGKYANEMYEKLLEYTGQSDAD